MRDMVGGGCGEGFRKEVRFYGYFVFLVYGVFSFVVF